MGRSVARFLAGVCAFGMCFCTLGVILPMGDLLFNDGPSEQWGAMLPFLIGAIVFALVGYPLGELGRRAPVPESTVETHARGGRATTSSEVTTARTIALMTSAARQIVADPPDRATSADDLDHLDALLSSYEDKPVAWAALWREARQSSEGVVPFEERPYWGSADHGDAWVPLTVVAFWGVATRRRVARDPSTDRALLRLMSGDPDEVVRDSAGHNLRSR